MRKEREREIREFLGTWSSALRHTYPTQIRELTIWRHRGTKVFDTMTPPEEKRKTQMMKEKKKKKKKNTKN